LALFKLAPEIVPVPVVTLQVPVSPTPATIACKLAVVVQTVWLLLVTIVALTLLLLMLTVPLFTQPLRLAVHPNWLVPKPKPLTVGLELVPLLIVMLLAPLFFVQFHTVLPVTVLPVISVALAVKVALLVHTVWLAALTLIALLVMLTLLALLHVPRLTVHVNTLITSFRVTVAVGMV
jgi:hypothetical protein